jgi:Uma2 family endonuclease
MSAITEHRLSLQRFRELYAECKPRFELIDGVAVQKASPTNLHSILQFVLALMLKDSGSNPVLS